MNALINLLSVSCFLLFTSNLECTNSITINEKGINDIVTGKSNLKDVQKEFGKQKIKKRWHKAREVECFGKYEYYLDYDKIATFSTITSDRNKRIIHKITIDSSSQCLTKEGSGIGSTYQEIVAEFGVPNGPYFFNDNGEGKTKLFYENKQIVFLGKDTLTNKVCEIVIW